MSDQAKPNKTDPALATQYLSLFLQLAEEHGWDTAAILEGSGVTTEQLEDEQSYVSFEQLDCLLKNCSVFANEPATGLYLGEKLQLSSHGILGMAVMGSPTFLEGIQIFRKFLKIRTQLVHISVGFEGFCLTNKFTFLHDVGDMYQFMIDAAISGSFNVLKSSLGVASPIEAIRVTFPEPDYCDVYTEIFGDIVEFGCEENLIRVPLKTLIKSRFSGNKSMQALVTRECEALLAEQSESNSVSYRVSIMLRKNLMEAPGQEVMAKRLGYSPRTLRRHLQSEGVRYHEIVEATKKEVAVEMLQQPNLSIEEIAVAVGYTESTNFIRAFKRWTGVSPSQFRQAAVE